MSAVESGSELLSEPLVVPTRFGKVRGYAQGDRVSFTSLPFAEARTPEDVFSPPRPPRPWAPEIADAHPNRPATDQSLSIMALREMIEQLASGREVDPRPVVVFVHGGRYETGGSEELWYRGGRFAESGCVYVAINYRKCFEGFLPLEGEELPADYDPEVEHGYFRGAEDVIAALRWVQENIGSFGGDPDQVTAMGQSAGAALVAWALCSPRTEGAIHRAVLLSPAFPRAGWQPRAKAARRLLRVPLTPEALAQVDPSTRAKAYKVFTTMYRSDCAVGPHPFDPAWMRPVPMLIGSMHDEFMGDPWAAKTERWFAPQPNPLRRLWGRALGQAVNAMMAKSMEIPDSVRATQNFGHFLGDQAVRRWVSSIAETNSRACPTWMYEFLSEDGPHQAQHCGDLPLVFDDLGSRRESVEFFCGQDVQDRLQPLATRFHRLVADFARGCNPEWENYSDVTGRTMMGFDVNSTAVRVVHDPLAFAREHYLPTSLAEN